MATVKIQVTFLLQSPDGQDALIANKPYGDFDPDEDMCMVHRIGSTYADGPVTFQAALAHGGPWENPPVAAIIVELEDDSVDRLLALT